MSDKAAEFQITFPDLSPLEAARTIDSLRAFLKAELPDLDVRLKHSDHGAQFSGADILAFVMEVGPEFAKWFVHGASHEFTSIAGMAAGYATLKAIDRYLESHPKLRAFFQASEAEGVKKTPDATA